MLRRRFAPPPTDRAETARLWLDEAHRLADWHTERARAFEGRATQLLAFTAVALALLPVAASSVSSIGNHGWRHVAAVLLSLASLALAVSAGFCLATVWPGKSQATPAAKVRGNFLGWAEGRRPHTPETLTLALARAMYGETEEESTVVVLAGLATRRGKRLRWATVSAVGAVALLAAVLVIVVLTAGWG